MTPEERYAMFAAWWEKTMQELQQEWMDRVARLMLEESNAS